MYIYEHKSYIYIYEHNIYFVRFYVLVHLHIPQNILT